MKRISVGVTNWKEENSSDGGYVGLSKVEEEDSEDVGEVGNELVVLASYGKRNEKVESKPGDD